MDLIYMNGNKEDVGVMQDFKFDLAYGYDENDFELTTSTKNHVCEAGNIIYIENTEYGGIIRRIRVATKTNELVYCGKTWHGILSDKIIQPESGKDYLVCNGEANSVISTLIEKIGLSDVFIASTDDSGLTISNYQMNRYIDAYEGIKKMLGTVDGKLKFTFSGGFVVLSAEKLVDYSQDDEFDSSQIDFDVEKNYKPTNHMICLGKGELKDRLVIHLYTDEEGNVSHTQTQFGLDEVTDVYDNSTVESSAELEQGGIDKLKEAWNSDSLQIDLDGIKEYDIGDIVGARENTTGIFMAKPIIKKIVTIDKGITKVEHKVGE